MIASLLASKGGMILEWYEVYNSVGTGLENNQDVRNMRNILSLSYYDMPSHLRTCFLYLSVFPEDYIINKVCLINMWIAEGFIQSGKQGQTLLEVGESYFNDLINRSMIQPMYDWYSGVIEGCRVHDMGLDLICSLSNEENYVTVLNGTEKTSPSNTIRRLSLQNGKDDHSMTWATKSLQQVRIAVRELQPKDLEILGRLPALRSLELEVDYVNLGILGRFIVGSGSFPCLVHCKFWGFVEPVVFQEGAMPRLKELYLDMFFNSSSDGGLDMSMENLPLLQDVFIEFRSEVASTEEMEQAKVTLRPAAEMHPNHPRLTIYSH